jgi:hypothetical protein
MSLDFSAQKGSLHRFVWATAFLFTAYLQAQMPGPIVAVPLVRRTVIQFEDFAKDTVLRGQYENKGVIFPYGVYVDQSIPAFSGTRFIRSASARDEFNPGALVIAFPAPVRVVSFVGTAEGPNYMGTLRAYGASGAVIATDGPRQLRERQWTTFTASASADIITRIEFEIPPSVFEFLDDLRFESAAAIPTSMPPPTITISSPAQGATLDDRGPLHLQGTVSGAGMVQSASLTVDFPRPPRSSVPVITQNVQLSGTAPNRTFDTLLSPWIGTNWLTARVEAPNGARSETRIAITYFPSVIRERFMRDGGAATFGNFLYGIRIGDGEAALYDRGAVATSRGIAHSVQGAIFRKWLGLQKNPGIPDIGCPISDAKLTLGRATFQDFRDGRVYSMPERGAFFVPSGFVQVLANRGDAGALPLADPDLSQYLNVFQRFQPLSDRLPIALMLTNEGILQIEQQGGSPQLSLQIPGRSNVGTIREKFRASNGRIDGTRIPPAATSRFLSADQKCRGAGVGSSYNGITNVIREWQDILGLDVSTPVMGVVKSAGISDSDDPRTHAHSNDYDLHLIPLPEYRNLLVPGQSDLEVEFEDYYARNFWFLLNQDRVRPGDVLFLSGRWIVDCGHEPFHNEIHPPGVLAVERTEWVSNEPATVVYLWVNGFYNGQNVDVIAYPPPRPRADVRGVDVIEAVHGNNTWNVTVNAATTGDILGGPVLLQVRGPLQTVSESNWGEMHWQVHRGYVGRWIIQWR